MGHFFKPWRRNFGVVTLVVACVCMGGWLRSYVFADRFSYNDGLYFAVFISKGGGVSCLAGISDRDPRKRGIQFSSVPANKSGHFLDMLSYASIVIPLMLLSGLLLLSKPIKAKSKAAD